MSENVVPLGHTITMCVVEDEQQNKLFCKWIILASRQSCRTASTPEDSHEQQQNNILKQQNKGAVNDSRVRGPIPSVPNTATHSHAVLFLHKSDCLPLGSLSPTWTLKRPVMGMINGSRKKKGGHHATMKWSGHEKLFTKAVCLYNNCVFLIEAPRKDAHWNFALTMHNTQSLYIPSRHSRWISEATCEQTKAFVDPLDFFRWPSPIRTQQRTQREKINGCF